MAVTTRWVVSEQGNQNLLLGASDKVLCGTPSEAEEVAERLTRHENRTHYVHVVIVKPVLSFTPGPVVRREL